MMSPRFNKFIGFVLDHEGRYFEDDKDDPGGRTKFGVDQRSHPGVDIKNLTEEGAKEIYFTEWTQARCEGMPYKLGESHFDATVNTGAGRSAKFLLASRGDVARYNDERDAFYHRLAEARPKSRKYLKGWLARTADLRKFLGLIVLCFFTATNGGPPFR